MWQGLRGNSAVLAQSLTEAGDGTCETGNNVRVDIAQVTFCKVVIDTLVKLCTQVIDVE